MKIEIVIACAAFFGLVFASNASAEDTPDILRGPDDIAELIDVESTLIGACGIGNVRVVPDLLGLSRADAEQALERCALRVMDSEQRSVFSHQPIGSVGQQYPGGGNFVRRGSIVSLSYSAGLIAPNLLGQNEADVLSYLGEFEIPVRLQHIPHPAAPGEVVSQNPSSGESIRFSLGFSLTVSEGPWIELPNLSGVDYYEATQVLAGLNVSSVHAGGSSLDIGERRNTNCETEVWYPVIDRTEPPAGRRIFPADTGESPIRVFTSRFVDVRLNEPPAGYECQ